MTSYLRSWLTGAPTTATPDIPSFLRVSPPASDDGEDTETEQDDNSVPAFPALNSAQRAAPSQPPRILSDSALMPPPPPPSLATRTPGVSSRSSAKPSSSSLLAPAATTQRPLKPTKKRDKVALAPGHSPLDWAALKSSGEDLRGVDTLMRIPPSVLKQHRSKSDAWSAFNGKVYNITPYLAFHPGGERELMRVAGRDGTELFAATHAWVNADFMLDSCLVGFLISEPSPSSDSS
ncbi:cytochrome b5-like heme/steroid binding domain-containing protein [Mycena rosella]|uniref:Cytochrome b5-like heme/steroid binding domain-containing protein n=1 Tax=Mycena rosella TaxID=1033263 RepID=A0AAD7M9Z6_MYCRO|nr:cytochrome b5-like heme/steroid binding domain-containing protein [Mycena rosella]